MSIRVDSLLSGQYQGNAPQRIHTAAGIERIEEIARHYGLTPDALRDANPGLSVALPGDQVALPQQPDAFARTETPGMERLEAFAQRHGVTVEELLAYNGLTEAQVYPGTALSIPSRPCAAPLSALVELANISELAPQSAPTDARSPKLLIGEGKPHETVREYVVLIPSDHDIDQRALMREIIADVLLRNGRAVDDVALDQIAEASRRPDGNFDFDRHDGGSNMARRGLYPGPGGTRFEGYSLQLKEDFQQAVLTHADALRGPPLDGSAASKERALAVIARLKDLAGAAGATAAKEALDALEQAIKAGDGSALEGYGSAVAIFKTVIEFAKLAGVAGEAADLLGRVGGMFALPVDAARLGQSAYKLYSGLDPVTGKPLNTDQKVEAALELLDAGFNVATDVGQIAAIGGSTGLAQAMATAAPPVAIILCWAKLNYEVLKLGREAYNSIAQYEFNQRFPRDQGQSSAQAVQSLLLRVEGLPTSENNAALTTRRIVHGAFNNIDTAVRFRIYLGRSIGQENVTRIVQDKVEGISPAEMTKIAEATKQAVREFVALEHKDVKEYVLAKGGLRRGDSYFTPAERARRAR